MTELAWVLRQTGPGFPAFLGPSDRLVDSVRSAARFHDRVAAEVKAQSLAYEYGHCDDSDEPLESFLYAIPIERETERKVEEIEGPAELYVLQSGKHGVPGYFASNTSLALTHDIETADAFSPTDLLIEERPGLDKFTPIPVRVTETPGEWKEVEE